MNTAVWYSVDDSQERFQLMLAGEVELARPFESGLVAEECAHDFYYHRIFENPDDLLWPILVKLYRSETDPCFASWRVDMDTEPRFLSTEMEEQ